jgi:hypothetical protein
MTSEVLKSGRVFGFTVAFKNNLQMLLTGPLVGGESLKLLASLPNQQHSAAKLLAAGIRIAPPKSIAVLPTKEQPETQPPSPFQ